MIESAMYFGLGFLASGLLGLIVLHFAWQQAARLTRQRVEAAVPLSLEELRADKDRLRAEFALNARRLEKLLEDAREENARHRRELDANADAMRTMVAERDARTEAAGELEARGDELREELRAREEELARTSGALREAERTLKTRNHELAELRSSIAAAKVARGKGSAATESKEAPAVESVKADGEASDTIAVDAIEAASLLAGLQHDLATREAELIEAQERIATLEDENAALRIQRVHRQISPDAKDDDARDDAAQDNAAESAAAEATGLEASTDRIALSAQILELEARNAEARAEIDRLTLELEQHAALSQGAAAAPASSASQAETEALRDELKSLAATLAHMTAQAEGDASPINALIAADGDNDDSDADTGGRKSIAARLRRLALRPSSGKDAAARKQAR